MHRIRDILRDFDLNDLRPVVLNPDPELNPSLAQIQVQPIATSTPYIDIRLTAQKQSKLDTLDFLSFVTPLGQVIHQYPINQPVSDALVLSTEEFRLPNVSFYLRLEGKDNSKSFYQCIHAVDTQV